LSKLYRLGRPTCWKSISEGCQPHATGSLLIEQVRCPLHMLGKHWLRLQIKAAFLFRQRERLQEKQAKAVVETLRDVNMEDVATKQDLLQLYADIFKWAVPLLLGQVALFAGIASAVLGGMLSTLK
jgi:hypothetical protein